MGSRSKNPKELNTRNTHNVNMVTVRQLIATEKKAMTKQEYRLLIKMCKQTTKQKT